ncbi:MAG: proline--tRNA ligase [Nanoarchaeota archaeon]
MGKNKNPLGITVKKSEDFSEWYTQLLQKAELIEYSAVSGCYILRPNSYHIWEKVQEYFNKLIKEDGVRNAYFPLFIPESLLTKEEKHIEGFAAEVAWVESGGSSKLQERLAVRPTSETIINDTYSKWIRSHQDLPLRLNQWCNVVRWEFKHPIPFLRSREFLWQEGHTAFATKEEAVAETRKILDFYERLFTELYALPVLKGTKSKAETFAGAEFTLSLEIFLPNGKAVQGCTSHHLDQNFARAFNITFQDEKQNTQFVWQNSWGISTRSIGIMVMMHSDDKGLVLPPRLALTQAVIVPILFDDSKTKVLKEAHKIKQLLEKKGISVHLDEREGYSPGWKFNEWEMKGIPVRIEIGPKDVEKNEVMVARRDTGEKQSLPLSALETEIKLILEQMQKSLYEKARANLDKNIQMVEDIKDAEKALSAGKLIFAPWCATEKCEESFKEKTGAKSLNSPFQQPVLKKEQKCFACKNKAQSWFYLGKSY